MYETRAPSSAILVCSQFLMTQRPKIQQQQGTPADSRNEPSSINQRSLAKQQQPLAKQMLICKTSILLV